MRDAAPVLTTTQLAFLASARRAVLGTIAPDGRARLVPVCFVVEPARAAEDGEPVADGAPGRRLDGPAGMRLDSAHVAWIPLDDKPKSVADVRDLARVRDILVRPAATLLVDRWSEDWSRLAWLRCVGTAHLVEPADLPAPSHARILAALRAKHPQYRDHALNDRPLIGITIEGATGWGAIG